MGLVITTAGIFAGALCLSLIDRVAPHLHKMVGSDIESHNNASLSKVLLFVTAIAIHNLPEGIAAGVGFGSGDSSQALMIAGGIALQNVPEGMVIIGPMLAAGVTPRKTFVCAMITGLVEVAGALAGYFAVSLASAILPFALAFAGGAMLYVISARDDSRDPRPRQRAGGHIRAAGWALHRAGYRRAAGVSRHMHKAAGEFPGGADYISAPYITTFVCTCFSDSIHLL